MFQCMSVVICNVLVHQGKFFPFLKKMSLTLVLSLFCCSIIPLFFHTMSVHHEVFVFSCKKKRKESLTIYIQRCIFSIFPSLYLSLSLSHTHICMRLSPHMHTRVCAQTHTHTDSQLCPSHSK